MEYDNEPEKFVNVCMGESYMSNHLIEVCHYKVQS
jgi:hypothetical protein